MPIILAGGGSKSKSYDVDRRFATLLDKRPLLYIPVAMPPEKYSSAQCLQWFLGIFAPLGRDDVVMWTDLRGKTATDLKDYSGIYVGGGNTFLLLDIMRRSGIIKVLSEAIASGKLYYGGSAGAVMLGKSILTSTDENAVGLKSLKGLDLLSGYSVKCHYSPANDAFLQEFVATHSPVIAIPEESGVLIENGRFFILGTAPVTVFTAGGRRSFTPGEMMPADVTTHP